MGSDGPGAGHAMPSVGAPPQLPPPVHPARAALAPPPLGQVSVASQQRPVGAGVLAGHLLRDG